MSLRIGMGVLIFLLVCSSVFSQDDRLTELQKKIMAQQQVLKELEEQLDQKENTTRTYTQKIVSDYLSEPAAQQAPGIMAGYDKGFFIKTTDSDYEVKINGFVKQHLFFGVTDTVSNNTQTPAEGRVDFHFYFKKDLHVRIRPDFFAGNNAISLREAYIEYLGVDYFKGRLGAFITPFSMEALTNPADLQAIFYSPYIYAIPFRDVGAMIFGNGVPFLLGEFIADYFTYEVGVFNGQGMNNTNVDDDMMFMAAGTFYPMTNKEKEVFVRAAVFTNQEAGFRNQGARLSIFNSSRGQTRIVFGGTGRTEDDTDGNQAGVSVAYRYRKDGLRIEGEYIWLRFDRDEMSTTGNDLSPLEMWGVSSGISYFIEFGDPKQNMGIEPTFKFSYTTVDDKTGDRTGGDERRIQGQSVWEMVLGARFHMNKHTRVDFNWVMYDLERAKDAAGNSYHNRDNGGGQLFHSFVFQFIFHW